MPEESQRTCAGTSATGEPCRAPEDLLQVDPEDSESFYCFAHAPWLEAERALAQRKGGLRTASKHRKFRYLDPSDLGDLDTPADAKRWSVVIARGLATGRLSSAAGQAALRAVQAFLQSLEVIDLHERLSALEVRQADVEQQRARVARARHAEEEPYLRRATP